MMDIPSHDQMTACLLLALGEEKEELDCLKHTTMLCWSEKLRVELCYISQKWMIVRWDRYIPDWESMRASGAGI